MVVVMAPGAEESQIEEVTTRLKRMGLAVHRSTGKTNVVLGAIGDIGALDFEDIRRLPGVQDLVRVSVPYKLVSRAFHPESTRIDIGGGTVGDRKIAIMAGPCAVESEEQTALVAESVARSG